MLHEFVVDHRTEILARCHMKVIARYPSVPMDRAADYGVPVFLDQLLDTLRHDRSATFGRGRSKISRSAVLDGNHMRHQGFTISQVVHHYGDICQAITELAMVTKATISADDFRILNGCLDEGIAGAITEYTRKPRQTAIDDESARGNERLGFLAHELRNLIHTALAAFEIIKAGNVGVTGSTGAILQRSLVSTRDLIARSLTEVRLTEGIQNRERVLISSFITELAAAASLFAQARGIEFQVVQAAEADVAIEADRQIVASALTNLLQNAIKFTHPRTVVSLQVRASAERVLFEVQDECGGLAAGDVDDSFRPFEQRGADRSGLGLGLAFSRWAIEANHGRVYARNLPGIGCVFTIDLPRAPNANATSS
jgi:signal transduction histidine kinase